MIDERYVVSFGFMIYVGMPLMTGMESLACT